MASCDIHSLGVKVRKGRFEVRLASFSQKMCGGGVSLV